MKEMGLIWRMDSKKGLLANIDDALREHAMRYGLEANLVDVNPDDLGDQKLVGSGITIRSQKSVLKGEIFVGRRI